METQPPPPHEPQFAGVCKQAAQPASYGNDPPQWRYSHSRLNLSSVHRSILKLRAQSSCDAFCLVHSQLFHPADGKKGRGFGRALSVCSRDTQSAPVQSEEVTSRHFAAVTDISFAEAPLQLILWHVYGTWSSGSIVFTLRHNCEDANGKKNMWSVANDENEKLIHSFYFYLRKKILFFLVA